MTMQGAKRLAKNTGNSPGVFIAIFALDRATKCWALSYLASYRPKEHALLSLGLHFNRGISFSLLENHARLSLTITLVTVGLLGLLCVKSKALRSTPGMVFLWAGAIGNLTDRLWYGYVIDWIYIFAGYVNLADVWLCVGGGVVLFILFQASFRRL
ncbi:MAG: signal peptidase II [Synergistaceae bacterium]|jgi:signal peptidase II|nr:signal peptidase II [Synergistaceae bacterium]